MELAKTSMIPQIDKFAEEALSIPSAELMRRSGVAASLAVKELTEKGKTVIILAGKGNNGGDGYAAACELLSEYSVSVFDVFFCGQRSEAGKYWLEKYRSLGGKIVLGIPRNEEIASAACIVDAIFGTGFTGDVPKELLSLSKAVNSSSAKRVAIDIPLGVNAEDGRVSSAAISVDKTVALSFIKPGLISYPAMGYTGEVVLDTLGLPKEKIIKSFAFSDFYTDAEWARARLPRRPKNSNKGSFGKAFLVTGSKEYEGAARLSLEAALRSGAGLVSFAGEVELCNRLISDFPEAVYNRLSLANPEDVSQICAISARNNATLVGSGSGCTKELFNLVKALLGTEGGSLVIDADGINALAKYGSPDLIKDSGRRIILTPHPLEFSRLCGESVEYIQNNRLAVAKAFAKKYKCALLLKGAATVITDGEITYINGSGSSALAKGGSGDVLSGLLVSLLAFMSDAAEAAALAAYIHGRAGDSLEEIYSPFGVTPSDLPREIAKIIARLVK